VPRCLPSQMTRRPRVGGLGWHVTAFPGGTKPPAPPPLHTKFQVSGVASRPWPLVDTNVCEVRVCCVSSARTSFLLIGELDPTIKSPQERTSSAHALGVSHISHESAHRAPQTKAPGGAIRHKYKSFLGYQPVH